MVDSWFARTDAVLLGRTTYDIFAGCWPEVTDPDNLIATTLNNTQKYVVSTTLDEAPWNNSTVISADVVEAVGELKSKPGGELQIHGSCALGRSLHDAGLIDEYRLIVFPVVVGTGKKLFADGCVPLSLPPGRVVRHVGGRRGLHVAPDGRAGGWADVRAGRRQRGRARRPVIS